MNPSVTKSKSKKQKNKTDEDVDTIIPKILAKKRSISEVSEHSTSNKKPAKTKNFDNNQSHNQKGVFTKEQEVALRNHIIKCCQTQYGVTNTTIRKMIYDYATKLPNCKYPGAWDNIKMACVDWFLKFRGRHPGLKKALTKKLQHTCICIMGCHMGQEGKQALKELEAKVLIARVYRYLHREYEYMQMCNDLSLLVNILRRTAEATGVCEQTITKILEEEKRNTMELNDIIPGSSRKKKKDAAVIDDHNYSSNKESSHVEAVDEDSNNSNNLHVSDFERLQQNETSIKSVMVEILDEDLEVQNGQNNTETRLPRKKATRKDSIEGEPNEQNGQNNTEARLPRKKAMRKDSIEGEPNETDDKLLAKHKRIRIIFADDEPSKSVTCATRARAVKPNSTDPVSNNPVSDDPELVIDEVEMSNTCTTRARAVKPNSTDPVSTNPVSNDPVSDDPELVIDEVGMTDDKLDVPNNKIRIIFADDEPKQDSPLDAEDTAIRIGSPAFKYTKPHDRATESQAVVTKSNDPVSSEPSSLEYEGELVIDESQMNLDYDNPDDKAKDTEPTENTENGMDKVIPTKLQHENPVDTSRKSKRKRRRPMDIFHGHMKIAVKNATSLSVDDRMTS